MTEVCDIIIVGAGAAGLTAGIAAGQFARQAQVTLRIVLLDAARRFAGKILVAGGGRCNLTHDPVRPEDFNGSRNIVRNVLAGFDASATMQWLESLGVPLIREEDGKVFPAGQSGRAVLDALVRECGQVGATIRPQCRVREISPDPPCGDSPSATPCTVRHEWGELKGRRIVLCTGGASMPATGTTGQGWDLARQLGHTVTDVHPALVPLLLQDGFFHAEMAGLTHEAELSAFVDGKRVDRRTGSMLWTHFGISGPVVLDISRHWTTARAAGGKVELRCNFLPGESFEQVERWLTDQAASPHRRIDSVLASRLPRRLAERIARTCHIGADVRAGRLRREDRRQLVHALTQLPLPVVGDRGWKHAEVTAGGVPLQEIDYRTMESRKCPGLHLAGEMLDCDGRVGGFNLQWAWSTGHLAGRAAARSLLRPV